MRAIEAAEVARNPMDVLHFVEKSRQTVLVLKTGVPHCLIKPVSKIRRTAKKS